MRVLVCGSHDWDDEKIVGSILNGFFMDSMMLPLVVIHGGAAGADAAAARWAYPHQQAGDIRCLRFPADRNTHDKVVGPIRNQQKLDQGKPDLVLAFTDDLSTSKVTADMVRRAKAAGVPVYVWWVGRERETVQYRRVRAAKRRERVVPTALPEGPLSQRGTAAPRRRPQRRCHRPCPPLWVCPGATSRDRRTPVRAPAKAVVSPERAQLSRRKGSKIPPNTVSVARPSKWGNPWKVASHTPTAAET